jgi:hypothetical protein
MTLTKQFDAAYPPSSIPAGCGAVAGYIGRAGYTPHIWTPAQWQPFKGLYQVPIWVPDVNGNPAGEAADASATAAALGWAAHHPDTRTIVFDLETTVDPSWWRQLAVAVAGEGFQAVPYGSLSTVLGNGAAEVWTADWDGDFTLQGGRSVEATQYQANVPFDGTDIDLSICSAWWTAHAGTGPRWGA